MRRYIFILLMAALPTAGYPIGTEHIKQEVGSRAIRHIKQYSILIEYKQADKAYGNVYRVIKPFYEKSTRDGCCDVSLFVKHIYSIEGANEKGDLIFKPAIEAIPDTDISSLYFPVTLKLVDTFIPKDHDSDKVSHPLVFKSLSVILKEELRKSGKSPDVIDGEPSVVEIDLSKNKSVNLCQTIARGDDTTAGIQSESYTKEELTYLGYPIDWDCNDAYNWFKGNI